MTTVIRSTRDGDEQAFASERERDIFYHSNPVVTEGPLGKRRRCCRFNSKEWAFLAVSTINILAALGLTLARFITLILDHRTDVADFTLSILLLVNIVFCIFYAIHGVLNELEFEIYALAAAITVVLIYCIVEYIVNASGRNVIKEVRLVVGCILGPFNLVLCFLVARDFGWLQFRIVGASEFMQNLYLQSRRFTCLLKFDLQAAASFVILVLRKGAALKLREILILSIGLPFCLIWVLVGWLAMRREWKHLSIIFAITGLFEPAYIIYKICQIYLTLVHKIDSAEANNSTMINVAMLVAGSLAVAVRFFVYFEFVLVYRNFGKGLRERAFSSEAHEGTSLLRGGLVTRY